MCADAVPDNRVALIDLDGTLADYESAMHKALLQIQGPMESLIFTGDEYLENRMNLIKAQPGFWENLPPIYTGLKVFDVLGTLGYQRMILTKGPRNTETA